MQDADQAGLSAEGQDLSLESIQASLTPESTKAEKLEVFKRMAAFIEREEEEEKKKKLRQGNSSTLVGKPVPSTAPLQGPRKRTAPFGGAKDSFKRRRVGPLQPSRSGEQPIAAPSTVPDSEAEGPDAATQGKSSAPVLLNPEAPILATPIPFPWTKPLLCIIQVNKSSRVGTFAEDAKDWAFQLTFNAGRRPDPTISIKIFSTGVAGPQRGQIGWCLGHHIERDWMVTDFKIQRVADCAGDRSISHNKILTACKTNEEKTRLVCISLDALPKISGDFSGYARCKKPHQGVKELHSAVFNGRRPYHLYIWFLAPVDLETFEKQCLSDFTRFFEQRKLPPS